MTGGTEARLIAWLKARAMLAQATADYRARSELERAHEEGAAWAFAWTAHVMEHEGVLG